MKRLNNTIILPLLAMVVLWGGFAVNAAALNVSIIDKIKSELSDENRGKLVAEANESGIYTFEWYRSIDGSSWSKIERQKMATVFGHDYYNVSETGSWLDPAIDRLASEVTDNSKRLIYKVKIKTRDGSSDIGEIISYPYQIPYYSALMNGDFENLLLADNLYPYPWSGNPSATNPNGRYWVSSDLTDAQIEANARPVYQDNFKYERHENELIWKTTDKFGCLEIMNASPNKSVYANTSASYNKGTYQNFILTNIFNGERAGSSNGATFDGEQMAELNSESIATLYQDILTVPGSELKWDIWHRARAVTGVGHIDEMRVLIMDAKRAETIVAMYPTNPQDAVKYIIEHPDEFPGALISDKLQATVYQWTEHTGTYSVPEGQNLTRLFFVSESGNPGMGNLLDGISFSKEDPDPGYHEAVVTIQKTISGVLTDDQLSNLKVNIEFSVMTGSNMESVKGQDMFWQSAPDGKWIGSWTRRYTLDKGEKIAYSVTEKKSSAELTGLSLDYSDSGNTEGYLVIGSICDIQFYNNYKYPYDKIIIEKRGLKEGESAVFSVYDQSDPSKAVKVILTGVDNLGTTVSQKMSVEFTSKYITVKELPWSWAYEAQGSIELSQDITADNGTIFTFSNSEKEDNPLHSEAIKNNSIINSHVGVTVDEWEKENRKLNKN